MRHTRQQLEWETASVRVADLGVCRCAHVRCQSVDVGCTRCLPSAEFPMLLLPLTMQKRPKWPGGLWGDPWVSLNGSDARLEAAEMTSDCIRWSPSSSPVEEIHWCRPQWTTAGGMACRTSSTACTVYQLHEVHRTLRQRLSTDNGNCNRYACAGEPCHACAATRGRPHYLIRERERATPHVATRAAGLARLAGLHPARWGGSAMPRAVPRDAHGWHKQTSKRANKQSNTPRCARTTDPEAHMYRNTVSRPPPTLQAWRAHRPSTPRPSSDRCRPGR